MAKECGKCGFRMGTFQEVTTFVGNLARTSLNRYVTPKRDRAFRRAGAHFALAGIDNTVFRDQARCPKCQAAGRWVDL